MALKQQRHTMNTSLVDSIIQVIHTLTPEEQELVRQRLVASPPSHELMLLQKINQPIPSATQTRYNQLRNKLHAETLSPNEHQELLTLTDTIEQAEADRLQTLLELADLRRVTLPELMQQLNLPTPPVYA
jgi:hypothetical protein